jgi:hypothetical protein
MSKLILLSVLLLPALVQATNNPHSTPEDNDSSVVRENSRVSYFDTATIYVEDWSNHITFRYPEANFSPTETIPLVDTMFGYAFPVEKATTSGFGGRRHHKGVDIPLHTGDEVVAAFGGKVRYAKWNSGGFGNLVIIRHPNGLETYYAHLSRIKVKPNQVVKAGELIGLGGSTGRSYSPHLHFEVRYNHIPFDPEHIFDLEHFCLKTDVLDLSTAIKRGRGTVCYETEQIDHHSDEHDHDHGEQVGSKEETAENYHIVIAGDTLSKIGKQHGTTVENLCALNKLTPSSILQIDQKIRVK